VKGITDAVVDLESFEEDDEINFLLDPAKKRTKKQKILSELADSLRQLYPLFEEVVKVAKEAKFQNT